MDSEPSKEDKVSSQPDVSPAEVTLSPTVIDRDPEASEESGYASYGKKDDAALPYVAMEGDDDESSRPPATQADNILSSVVSSALVGPSMQTKLTFTIDVYQPMILSHSFTDSSEVSAWTETCHRLLLKFISKTSSFAPTIFGGTFSPSVWQRIFLSNDVPVTPNLPHAQDDKVKKNPITMAGWLYYLLTCTMQIKYSTSRSAVSNQESNEATLHGDSQEQLDIQWRFRQMRLAMAIFSTLFECWSCLHWVSDYDEGRHGDSTDSSEVVKGLKKKLRHHSVSHIYTRASIAVNFTPNSNSLSFVTEGLLTTTWECAHQLIAHGCMDKLWLHVQTVSLPIDIFNTTKIREGIQHWVQLQIDSPSEDLDVKHLENEDHLFLRVHHNGDNSLGPEDELQIWDGEDQDGSSFSFPTTSSSTVDKAHFSLQHPRMYTKAISIIMDAIFPCLLSTELLELTALKIMLTTGCRNLIRHPNPISTIDCTLSDATKQHDILVEAMLRGRRILLAMKVCYLIYLQTDSVSNRTTAQATLRQIVACVFDRVESFHRIARPGEKDPDLPITIDSLNNENRLPKLSSRLSRENLCTADTDMKDPSLNRSGNKHMSSHQFPSPHHKDAFLIIRSLCMLTMKPVSSNLSLNTQLAPPTRLRKTSFTSVDEKHTTTLSTTVNEAILDSKVLGLELLLEIFSRPGTIALLSMIPSLIFAVKHYLCYSLLSNCTSTDNSVVALSLKIFVPLIQNCRHHLKTEIEAFVTQVFFVLLDSKNTLIENKRRVVQLFEEICSDPNTLAEIFLNYDCDLSAVDLFQRIVNCLAKVAKFGLDERDMSAGSRGEKNRQDQRMLRLEGMKAMREILASLNASIISSLKQRTSDQASISDEDHSGVANISRFPSFGKVDELLSKSLSDSSSITEKQSFVQIYDSKKKRKEEEARVMIRFNQKPTSGIKYASQVGLVNGDDPSDIASFLIANNDKLDKTQIGEYLGRDPDVQDGLPLKILHHYVSKLDFSGLSFDEAIRFYLSGFRLPGEAQKIDRIMEKFAERYTIQNPDIFPSADCAFILAFSIIMLNTDLHNPAIKEERRMTKDSFIRNNRGIADGKDLPDETLGSIFDRIKKNQISLKEDDEARMKLRVKPMSTHNASVSNALNPSPFFVSSHADVDKARENSYLKEREEIVRNTVSVLRRRQASRTSIEILATTKGSDLFVRTKDSGLQTEYVSPMFDVTWGPALSVFSTVMESANGTNGSMLLAIASDEELESVAENVASSIEICIGGFEIAITVAGLCGNDTAKRAFVHALSNFTLLGSGRVLEVQHIRCIEALLELGLNSSELLGNTWEYIFHSLSEVARLRQVYETLAKTKRTSNKSMTNAYEIPHLDGESQKGDQDDHSETVNFVLRKTIDIDDEEGMDKHVIDELNACAIYEHISADLINGIYLRSASLSIPSLKDFIFQLCRVSRIEISGYGGHLGNLANDVDLSDVHYRQQHTLLTNYFRQGNLNRHLNQPDMHSLERLIEVTHYNMESRPRLVFADLWNIVSSHLTSTALHTNPAVAIYAVDSFRQLSLQFLYKEELGVFEFQRRFLKPFEIIMLKSESASVKEHLLKCLQQIILVHGNMSVSDSDVSSDKEKIIPHGGLRSAWRPILAVIGRGGIDHDDPVAALAFDMLTEQIQNVISSDLIVETRSTERRSILRDNYFIDLVDAILMFVSGPRVDYALKCIENLVILSRHLSCPTNIGPKSKIHDRVLSSQTDGVDELGLWWPILLGLSKAVGDPRETVQAKSLDALFTVVNENFFISKTDSSPGYTYLGSLQTLQLVFRGILTPTLEYLEINQTGDDQEIYFPVPSGFVRFRSINKSSDSSEFSSLNGRQERIIHLNQIHFDSGCSWFDKSFDNLMDGCISLTLKSIKIFGSDDMIEDMLAFIHHCLVSDSGLMAVRGLMFLHQFILIDLPIEKVTDETWETVCHLLANCLIVNGLHDSQMNDGNDTETDSNIHSQPIEEFRRQEKELPYRRYIGSHAVSFIESLLLNEQISTRMGACWYFFLITALGRAIREWDQAASLFDAYNMQSHSNDCPHYAENALFGRCLLVKVLQYVFTKSHFLWNEEVTELENQVKSHRTTVIEECIFFIDSYVTHETVHSAEIKFMTPLLIDLIDCIQALEDKKLAELSSIGEVLATCIQIDNKSIRSLVSRILQRIIRLTTRTP